MKKKVGTFGILAGNGWGKFEYSFKLATFKWPISRTNKIIEINKEIYCRVLIGLLVNVTSFDLDLYFRVKVKGRKTKKAISQKAIFLKNLKK